VLGFAFAYVSNIHNINIFYDFCLLPAYFGYITTKVRIWNARCKARVGVRLGKLPVVRRTILQVLQFQNMAVRRKPPHAGQA
jgi:hypothetical protein